MFGLPAGSELILLVLIILLLFGSARLPRLARSLKEAKDEFKREKDGTAAPETPSAAQVSDVPETRSGPEPAPEK